MRSFQLLPKVTVGQESQPYMIWSSSRKRYEVFRCYDIRARLRDSGFHWDGINKCWHTKSARVAGTEKAIMSKSALSRGYEL